MVVYSDELCHWAKGSTTTDHKYVRREWKNGRWRYYYPEAKVPSLGISARKKLKAYEKTAVVTTVDDYKSKGNSISMRTTTTVGNPKLVYEKRDKAYKDLRKDRSDKYAKRDFDEANQWISGHVDLQMAYNKTLLGQAEQTVKKGKRWVSEQAKRVKSIF